LGGGEGGSSHTSVWEGVDSLAGRGGVFLSSFGGGALKGRRWIFATGEGG